MPTDPLPDARALAPGTILADRYRVEATLGEGGMGIVYLVEHVHMRKRFALKVLQAHWLGTPEVVARFEREAVAAAAIGHPNVAAATDFGRLTDGSFFLVLEYLEGRTLRSELDKGAIPTARALEIARSIALGVGAAHAKGIVHRDLKPENVMLVARDGSTDFVKVLDFGIARVESVSDANGQALLTHAGAILGTPDYMAPEQGLGAHIDGRADLYALGVMLFEMVTGQCPFRGGTVTLLRRHLMDEVPSIPEDSAQRVPESVGVLITRLMQKDREARFATALDLVTAIDAARDENTRRAPVQRGPVEPAAVASESPALAMWAASASRWARKRVRIGALVVGLVALLTMTAVVVRGSSEGAHAVQKSAPRATPPIATSDKRVAPAMSADRTAAPTEAAVSSPPASAATTRRRRTGPGGIYIPPPKQWFR